MIIQDINNLDQLTEQTCVAIGNFDGIHQGHIGLIKKTIKTSRDNNLVPTILTFDPMPEEFFNTSNFFRLMHMSDKYQVLEKYGIQQVIKIPFDKNFSEISKDAFIENILIHKLMIKHLIVGCDFKFGHKRLGDINLLKLYEDKNLFDLTVIELVKVTDKKVSSRDIRALIKNGDIKDANKLISKPFSLKGRVIHGEKRGRQLGYPTANIELYKSYPINGIFLVSILFENQKLYGLASWGRKPTFSNDEHVLEVNIFDFEADLYDKELKIIFIDKIRDQIKFNNKDDLIKQMDKDKKIAKSLLEKINEL